MQGLALVLGRERALGSAKPQQHVLAHMHLGQIVARRRIQMRHALFESGGGPCPREHGKCVVHLRVRIQPELFHFYAFENPIGPGDDGTDHLSSLLASRLAAFGTAYNRLRVYAFIADSDVEDFGQLRSRPIGGLAFTGSLPPLYKETGIGITRAAARGPVGSGRLTGTPCQQQPGA